MSFSIALDLQYSDALSKESRFALPSDATFLQWLETALMHLEKNQYEHLAFLKKREKSDNSVIELSIRIVDEAESQQLNYDYRGKNSPTNVLSFPSELPDYIPSLFIGDLVICENVVIQEAHEQQKDKQAHWAHMSIHGFLHLLGFDHIEDKDAIIMESVEIEILSALDFGNPYAII